MSWDTLTKIAHFSEILLSHNPLFGQKWSKQLWTKRPTFQNNPHMRRDASTWRAIYDMRCCPKKTNHENEKKKKQRKKEKLIVMSCTWKIRLSLNKNQEEKNVEKIMKKLQIHKSFFSCKELLFSLGDCVWNEKWPSFIILHWCRKLSDSLPFEPDNFLQKPDQGSLPTLGSKGKKDIL